MLIFTELPNKIVRSFSTKHLFFFLLCFCIMVCAVYQFHETTIKNLILDPIVNNKNKMSAEIFSYNINDFQKIGTGPQKLYVYSAYFQNDSWQSSIVVIGGLHARHRMKLYCKFYDHTRKTWETKFKEAHLKPLSSTENDFYGFPYVPGYITCNVEKPKHKNLTSKYKLPAYVSIMESSNPEIATNIIKINYKENSKKLRFALCTQPLYNNYEEPLKLAEWIEFHRLMGVEKITLYNTSIGPKTSCLIDSYGDFIETLPWSCPYKFQEEIIQGAQLVMANECLFRYKGVAEYLVIVDRDEMITPSVYGGNNYSEMLNIIHNQLSKQNLPVSEISEYNFRNGFFIGIWNKNTNTDRFYVKENLLANQIIKKLQTVTQINRPEILDPHFIRSKFILVPEKVIDVGIHFVAESVGNASAFDVSEEIAYSHHYRNVCPPFSCNANRFKRDSSSQKFAHQIADRIAYHFRYNANHCNIAEALNKDISFKKIYS